MSEQEPPEWQRALWFGAKLGMYQVNAIGGAVGAVVLIAIGAWWLAPFFVTSSVIGFAGWRRDYRLDAVAGAPRR